MKPCLPQNIFPPTPSRARNSWIRVPGGEWQHNLLLHWKSHSFTELCAWKKDCDTASKIAVANKSNHVCHEISSILHKLEQETCKSQPLAERGSPITVLCAQTPSLAGRNTLCAQNNKSAITPKISVSGTWNHVYHKISSLLHPPEQETRESESLEENGSIIFYYMGNPIHSLSCAHGRRIVAQHPKSLLKTSQTTFAMKYPLFCTS